MYNVMKTISLYTLVGLCFFGFSPHVQAQFSSIFSSTQGATAAPVLPECPPLLAGRPEGLTPSGQPWEEGINCAFEPATSNISGLGPTNTVDSDFYNEDLIARRSNVEKAASSVEALVSFGEEQLNSAVSNSTGRVGFSYINRPNYYGASNGFEGYSALFDVEIGTGGFLNNEDGLGWKLITLDFIEGRVSLNWTGEQKFSGTTEGLSANSNQTHFEADLVYNMPVSAYEFELSVPTNRTNGWTLTASEKREFPMATGTLQTTIGLTHASADWMNSYYGISASEASASGLSVYNPGAGLRDLFAEAKIEIPVTEVMGIELRGGARRILGPAEKSPQVDSVGSSSDFSMGLSFYYRY